MRLILLSSLLVVSALAVLPVDWQAKFEEWRNKRTANPEHLERFRSRMSNRTRALLQKEMHGVDIEERHRRLEKLEEKYKNKKMSTEKLAAIKEKIAKIRKIKTDKPPNVNATYLFEVNQLAGVSEYLYQGDIQLTEAQLNNLDSILENVDSDDIVRDKRQATTMYKKWTDAKLYYYLDSSINERKKDVIKTALQYIQSRTCIRFYENSTNPSAVKVFSGVGCNSAIGMSGNGQEMSLADGCEVFGSIAHEFTHALGVWHTQMRSDRDDYVTVDTSKIEKGYEHNFPKLAANEANNFVPYEYGSFMHYGASAFVAKAGDITIIPSDLKYVYTMGNRRVTFYDIQNLNEFYATCKPKTSAKCHNGGVPNPSNCKTCNCPLGYDGPLCTKRPVGSPVACGAELKATTTWQSQKFKYGNETSHEQRDLFTMCTHWIWAPTGKKIEVRLTDMFNNQCQYGCQFQGIEFKINKNHRETNPQFCCPEFNNVIHTGELNPMPVIAWNRYWYTVFTFEYRFV